MVETQLTVRSEQGLHGRPADMLVRAANKYDCEITMLNLTTSSDCVNAKSLLKVLSLGVFRGHEVQIRAEGIDEEQAILSITELVQSNFRSTAG